MGQRGPFQDVLDVGDHCMGLIAGSHPCHEFRGNQGGSLGCPDGFKDAHEGAAVIQGAEQGGALAQVLEQVLREIIPPEDMGGFTGFGADGDAILGVMEHRCSLGAVKRDVRFHGFGGAQCQGAGDGQPVDGLHADHGGIVRFNVVGAVEVCVHEGQVFRLAGSGDAQGSGNRVGQRIGCDAVHHIHAVEAAFARPARALVVGAVADPAAGSGDALERADARKLFRGFAVGQLFQSGQRMGTQALETDLYAASGCGCGLLEPEEVLHGGYRGLFQIKVGMGSEDRQSQGGVGLDRSSHDDHVRVVIAGQQVIQIGVDSSCPGQRSSGRRIGVRHGNEFHHTLRAQPMEVVEVVCSEAVDSYQGNPARVRYGVRSGCGLGVRACAGAAGCGSGLVMDSMEGVSMALLCWRCNEGGDAVVGVFT